ncbi:hypothetical protein E2C01_023088 [Portunus trituberculatus]|uniref:Uncharacterized protein n=1 Tax=Portunus trituberculatus TaxID=210409 RepID=A0A5B7E902_PORTR|nr:hypothetical protein [Portunus trituberculatus]
MYCYNIRQATIYPCYNIIYRILSNTGEGEGWERARGSVVMTDDVVDKITRETGSKRVVNLELPPAYPLFPIGADEKQVAGTASHTLWKEQEALSLSWRISVIQRWRHHL